MINGMEKMIIEYLDLIKKLNSDFNPDYKFINSLLEFTKSIKYLNRFSIGLSTKDVIVVNVGTNNCICDIQLDTKLDPCGMNVYIDHEFYKHVYFKNITEAYDYALIALNKNIF